MSSQNISTFLSVPCFALLTFMNALQTQSNSSELNDEECFLSASSIMDEAFFFSVAASLRMTEHRLAFLFLPWQLSGSAASIGNRAAFWIPLLELDSGECFGFLIAGAGWLFFNVFIIWWQQSHGVDVGKMYLLSWEMWEQYGKHYIILWMWSVKMWWEGCAQSNLFGWKRVFLRSGQKKTNRAEFWAKIHYGPLNGMNNNSPFCHF